MSSISKKLRVAGFWLVSLVASLTVLAQPLAADDAKPLRGVALVIGNADYAQLPDLPNPANDADAIEALLADLGFDSIRRSNRDAATLARDLERFAEDAANADVAILYYSGHGIEAGGENFLVPVDADLSALDAAGEKLVPLSPLIEKLKTTVPVAIVMLDACRTSPFPPGAMVRLAPGVEPAAIGVAGLGETRGVVALKEKETAPDETFGTVLAFAAEPGKVALDGDPGGNSPYAAAVLRHLDTMAGEEFGMVMRMVAEEVYLKTGGRQRPWISESLRRRLYFGKAAASLEGIEGEILAERRQLLVTIAELPDFERRAVERIAGSDGLPMDAVYAIFRALGQEMPDDPAQIEALLRAQVKEIRELAAMRAAAQGLDPEIERLSGLSRQAVAEGALDTARRLRDEITKLAAKVDLLLTGEEANIRRKRIALAATHADSATISKLALDHLAAAEYYRLAYEQVKGQDETLAIDYQTKRFNALMQHGNFHGDDAIMNEAVILGVDALRAAERLGDTEAYGNIQNSLGAALIFLRRTDEAFGLYEASLEKVRREDSPLLWAGLQRGLGTSLHVLGQNEQDPDKFYEAQEAFGLASDAYLQAGDETEWIMTQLIIGQTLLAIGAHEGKVEPLEKSLSILRATLDRLNRADMPLEWAAAWSTIGGALTAIGRHDGDAGKFQEAEQAYENALGEFSRERMPAVWYTMQTGLGDTLMELGRSRQDEYALIRAVGAYREALDVWQSEKNPREWVMAQLNLAGALVELGLISRSHAHIYAAKQALFTASDVDARNDYLVADKQYYRDRIRSADMALGEIE